MQYPANVTPDNTCVDATQPIEIGFNFQGSQLIAYTVNVYDCVTGKPVGYTTAEGGGHTWIYFFRLLDESDIYNNDRISSTFNMSGLLTNGHDYELVIRICQNTFDVVVFSGRLSADSTVANKVFIAKGTAVALPLVISETQLHAQYMKIGYESYKITGIDNSGDYAEITVDGNFSELPVSGTSYTVMSNYLDSKPCYMPCRSTAAVTATAGATDDGTILCTASYSQSEKVSIKKFRWRLMKKVNESWSAVAESDYIYSASLEYQFSEYIEDGYQYKAVCEIINQYDVSVSAESAEFSYTRSETVAVENADIAVDYENHCIKVQINKPESLEWVWYNIYRRTDNSETVRMINRCGTAGYFEDYLVSSNHTYQYYIVPTLSDRTICASYVTESISVSFDDWSLTSISYNKPLFDYKAYTTHKTIKFNVNVKSDDFKINKAVNVQETVSGYSNVSSSENHYISGSISGIIGIADDFSFTDTIQKAEEFSDFISSNYDYILKSPKGHMYVVRITDSAINFDDEISSQPSSFKLGFAETMKPENLIINYTY